MFRTFATKLIVLSTVLAVVIAVVNYSVPLFAAFAGFTWMALAFFFLMTLLTGYMGFRGLEKTAHGFVASVNGMVVLKLFMSVIFVIAFVLIAKPDSAVFISSFFIFYVVFSVFEIRELIKAQKIRRKEWQNEQH